ncbi:MAG: hypothetical protein IJ255_06195 [Bacteroidales bacterium]|nr:hypothetical protein [Bacteroidales bacterium]
MKLSEADRKEREKQVCLDVWQLHIVEWGVFLDILLRLCPLPEAVSDILGLGRFILFVVFVFRFVALWKGKMKPRYEPQQLFVTAFVILFNVLVRLFFGKEAIIDGLFFTAALLAFGFYLWKILWKGEIRKKE